MRDRQSDSERQCILQIEDEAADVFMLEVVFRRANITSPVHVVTDGQMAIDYLDGAGAFADREKHPLPYLVLLDLKLPRASGLEVLEWLRRQPALKKLVVLVFSSSAQPDDVDRAYELGANSFIQKPSDLEHTLQIAQLLKGWWLDYNQYAPIGVARRPLGAVPPSECTALLPMANTQTLKRTIPVDLEDWLHTFTAFLEEHPSLEEIKDCREQSGETLRDSPALGVLSSKNPAG